jgi:hypothetical protein
MVASLAGRPTFKAISRGITRSYRMEDKALCNLIGARMIVLTNL